MIEQTAQISEAEQLKKERKKARNKRQSKMIKRHCCRQCGQPKHYVCLEAHSPFDRKPKKPLHIKLFKEGRYYARKIYFNLARGFGLIE